MSRFYFAAVEALAALIPLLPLLLLLRRRLFSDPRRTAGCGIFTLYLSLVYALAGLPNVLYIRFEPNVNLEPFAYMFSDLDTTLLNVALFLPMGILLPLLWNRYRVWWRTVLFGFGASLTVEILQSFSGRATDINDLMTNTLGAILGYLAARLLLRWIPVSGSDDRKELPAVGCLTFLVMFFLHPFFSSLLWTLAR